VADAEDAAGYRPRVLQHVTQRRRLRKGFAHEYQALGAPGATLGAVAVEAVAGEQKAQGKVRHRVATLAVRTELDRHALRTQPLPLAAEPCSGPQPDLGLAGSAPESYERDGATLGLKQQEVVHAAAEFSVASAPLDDRGHRATEGPRSGSEHSLAHRHQ